MESCRRIPWGQHQVKVSLPARRVVQDGIRYPKRQGRKDEEVRVIGHDQIEYASQSDPGIRRAQNEDCQAVSLAGDPEQWQRQGHIFLVADGMGGHAVGELASELAANLIPHTYHKYAGEGPAPALRKAFLEANASIHARGQQNQDFKGMGTTGTALVLHPDHAWVAHVGDSRAYRIRQERIEQLTFDHSWVWELAKRQKVDPESLKGIGANYINRSLGPDPLVEVDIEGPHPVQPGDIFVLCSDGLSNQLSDLELGAIAHAFSPAEACKVLIHLANLRGGPDNITVVVARVPETHVASNSTPLPSSPATGLTSRTSSIPWPLVGLFLGVALATTAAVLSGGEGSIWSIVTFVLAALSVLAGLTGLARKYLRERGEPTSTFDLRPLQVYRQTPCPIEKSLVERVAHAEESLRDWAHARNADVDWMSNQQHRDLARAAYAQSDYVTAFREYCRAASPFGDLTAKNRIKDEGFYSLWEKTTV